MREIATIDLLTANSDQSRNSLLLDVLNTNNSVLVQLLNNFHYAARGKAGQLIVDTLTIVWITEFSGKFNTIFKLNFSNGCQDLSYDESSSMWISFEIDPAAKKMTLISEELVDRDPDTY
jgi:hypothetical protein